MFLPEMCGQGVGFSDGMNPEIKLNILNYVYNLELDTFNKTAFFQKLFPLIHVDLL